jgi:hypothetical protein
MRLFPIHAGDEVTVQLTPTIGIASLIKTNSVTIHYDGSQEEPKAAPGNKPSDTISMVRMHDFKLTPLSALFISTRMEWDMQLAALTECSLKH